MSRVEILEREITSLSPEELAELRRWFAEFDAQAWDRQFEADVKAGRLDALADNALRAHAAGKTTRFWSARVGLHHRAVAVESTDG